MIQAYELNWTSIVIPLLILLMKLLTLSISLCVYIMVNKRSKQQNSKSGTLCLIMGCSQGLQKGKFKEWVTRDLIRWGGEHHYRYLNPGEAYLSHVEKLIHRNRSVFQTHQRMPRTVLKSESSEVFNSLELEHCKEHLRFGFLSIGGILQIRVIYRKSAWWSKSKESNDGIIWLLNRLQMLLNEQNAYCQNRLLCK